MLTLPVFAKALERLGEFFSPLPVLHSRFLDHACPGLFFDSYGGAAECKKKTATWGVPMLLQGHLLQTHRKFQRKNHCLSLAQLFYSYSVRDNLHRTIDNLFPTCNSDHSEILSRLNSLL